MTRIEFIDIMTGIMEMYPGRFNDNGDLAMEIWYEALSDLDFATTKKAVINHVKNSKFPPTVADIRESYNVLIQEKKKLSHRMDELFEEMRNYYPNGSEDKDAENTYIHLIVLKNPKDRLEFATNLSRRVVEYVKDCELKNCGFDLSFTDCIKQMGKDL